MSNLEKALKQAIIARNKKNQSAGSSGNASLQSDSPNTKSHGNIALMMETRLKEKDELEKARIIYPDMSNGRLADQFREIRTHIYHAIRKSNSPIMVTSVSGKSGNTFVTKNIASAIAFDDAKTSLIVDCNIGDPGFDDLLTLSEPFGLTDIIERDIPLEEVIKPVGINRMRLISAGAKKESVTDYLTSSRLRSLFSELQIRYPDRIILVDSPAINDSADAKILSGIFEHVILVVPYRKVTATQIAKAIKSIGKERIIGVVINREPRFLSLFNFKKSN